MTDRRSLLKGGAWALAAWGWPGCGRPPPPPMPAPATPPAPPPVVRKVDLAPVDVSSDRVIRTTVGHRPHRPMGFRVEAESFGSTTVIHNYGHGGAGMSTSWGTAALVADLAIPHASRTVAVLGAGVVGLTTARELQRRGFDVTLYAADLPPHTTSNQSLACWTPTSGLVSGPDRSEAFDAQLRPVIEASSRALQHLAGRGVGVSWIDAYTVTDHPPGGQRWTDLAGGEILNPGEHPFPARYAWKRPTLRIEPGIYLDTLLAEVMAFGGRLEVRRFDGVRAVLALGASLVIDCLGLGAGAVFGDETLTPVKGQLVVLPPQPEVDYCLSSMPASAGGFLHMAPRSDGIILGGTQGVGDDSIAPDPAAVDRMVAAHQAFHDAMRGAGRPSDPG